VSVFRWTAPFFKRMATRWSAESLEWLAGFLSQYVAPGGRLLDLGGGTGDIGAGVARVLAADVVIADETPQMLALVSPDPCVSICLARAESLPFPDAFFDAVFCCDAFHHFRRQEAVAAEMARVVRPGGAILLLEMRPDGPGRLLAAAERLLGEPGVFRRPADLERLLAREGIHGTSEGQGGISYLFLGTRIR